MKIGTWHTLKDITLDMLPRLKKLREIHFNTQPEVCVELPLLMTRYMKQMDNSSDSSELRAAKRLKYILENKSALIHDNELLAGTTTTKTKGVVIYPQFMGLALWPELATLSFRESSRYRISQAEIDKLNLEIFPYWMDWTVQEVCRKDYNNPLCQRMMERSVLFVATKAYGISHTVPDYEVVVKEGLASIIKKAEEKRSSLSDSEADSKKRDFYKAITIVLEGVIAYARKLSQKATSLAERENDLPRKNELVTISKMCQRVPEERPTTFQEALQAIWICHVALHQENKNIGLSLGRLDQILFPLYRNGIKEGILSPSQAVELVGCFFLNLSDHLPMIPWSAENFFGGVGPNQAITLGGIDSSGEDTVNDLTYVMLRVIELLKVRDPNVNARYYPGVNPKEYLDQLCAVNINTISTPCFHNDIEVIKALLPQGYTLEDARNYSIVGCVGPVCGGKTFGHTGAIILNLISALGMALFLPPSKISSFADFRSAFEKLLIFLIGQSVELNNMLGKTHFKVHPLPLLSALTQDTLGKGKDVLEGGATYNTSGVGVVGLPEVVDSLCAIKELVFDKKAITCRKLAAAIEEGWKGYETLRAWLVNRGAKFGTDSKEAAEMAGHLIDVLHTEFQKRENYKGGKYTVGYLTMSNHTGLLEVLTGAVPSPMYRPHYPEITRRALGFVANLDSEKIANGHALNLIYPPGGDRIHPDMEWVTDTIEAYMQAGGLQVQFNLIDERTLLSIIKEYSKNARVPPDLVVRVFGFAAYFADLSPFMRGFIAIDAIDQLAGKGKAVIDEILSAGDKNEIKKVDRQLRSYLPTLEGWLRECWHSGV